MSLELALCHVGVRADTEQVVPDMKAAEPQILAATQQLANNIAGILGGIGIGFGISRLLGLAHESIAEAEKAIAAEKKLGIALRGVGNVAGFTEEQMNALAETLSMDELGIDTSEIKNAMAGLITYGIKTEDEFKRILVTSHEISSFWGGDMFHTVQGIAQALADPAKGMNTLGRQGFKMTDAQKKLAKQLQKTGDTAAAQAIIWEVLSGQENPNKTVSAMQKLTLEMGNLKEATGRALIPIKEQFTRIQVEILKVSLKIVQVGGVLFKMAMDFNEAWGGIPVKIGMVIGAVTALGAVMRTQLAKTTIAMLFTGWGALAVGIGVVIGLMVKLAEVIGNMKAVQDTWMKNIGLIKQAWTNLYNAVRTMFIQIGGAINAALGGPFAKLMAWFGIAKGGAEGFVAGVLQKIINFVTSAMEWMTALAENWRLIWNNMGGVVKFVFSYMGSLMERLGPFLFQAFGYGLNRLGGLLLQFAEYTMDVIARIGEGIMAMFKDLPNAIRRMMAGEDMQNIILQTVMGPLLNAKAFGEGLLGEAPDINKLLEMRPDIKKQFDKLGEAFDPIAKRKKELERLRNSDFGTTLNIKMDKKTGQLIKPDEPAWKAVLDPKRYDFADIGKKFQDELLKTGKNEKVDKQIELAEMGVAKQDEMLKQGNELIAAVKDGGGLAE